MTTRDFDVRTTHEAQTVITAEGARPIEIDDAALLFGAAFLRDGPDLVLRNDDAPVIRVLDYFRTLEPADLRSPDGATLRGHVVERLAGPEAPGQYAQAGGQDGAVPIGQVEAVEGTASVQRSDGTTEDLLQNSRIFLDDVVRTVGDSTLSITFADGTIFTLSADSRMVIDELIYSPDGNGNSATFNLVQGGFIFIAGQVAKTGGMEVNTPAATMGIRGTTVLADVQTEGGISTVEVTLTRDPDNGIGRVELFDLGGNLITTITTIDTKWIVSTDEAQTREVDRTAEDEAADNVLIAEAVAAYESAVDRFARDGSYIRLDDVSVDDSGTETDEGTGDDEEQIDLDSEDAEPIEDIQDDATPDTRDDGSFDEGRLQPRQLDQDADVLRTALEIAEDGPVAGQLREQIDLQGRFELVSATTNGTLMLSDDGSYSYSPNADFNGQDLFTYSVTRSDGTSVVGTVTISVTPVNDAPVIEDASLSGQEDKVLLGTAQAVDVDSDSLTYSLLAGAANGNVVVTSTGAWSYTPDANFEGTDGFDISVSDGEGAVARQRVTVMVAGVNDAPVISDDGISAEPVVFEDVAPSVSGRLIATDPDAGDELAWSGSAVGSYGSFTIDGTGEWTYTLGAAANSLPAGRQVTDRFDVSVTDSSGASASRTISIDVVGGNDAPVASNVTLSVMSGGRVQGTLIATDPDAEDSLTYGLGEGGPVNGTATVAADGSFSYVPDEGFAGLDGFDYTVTDGSGATTTARATVAVESGTVTVPGGSQVSVSIYPDPEIGPAGQIVAASTAPETTHVNLVFALDRSISITPEDWSTQINAVAVAVETLASQFEGSATQVDVNVIAYDSIAVSTGTFDLADPDLIPTIRALPLVGAGTNWDSALLLAESFFDSQPTDDLNFLYFVSDGSPTFPNWRNILARLTDSEAKGYSVDIEAFGIGPAVNYEILSVLDPDPVQLNSPEDLLAAIEATPLFTPTLAALSINLIADGVNVGEVADEGAAGINVDGLETKLALADIPGLADLLGDNNFFSVTAGFDLDGDPETAEVQLATSQQFTKQASAVTLEGTEGSDLLFGSDGDDVLAGNGGNDILFGFGGDDLISTGAGLDHVRAGAGDDRIRLESVDTPSDGFANSIDGGPGRDVLEVTFGGDFDTEIQPLVDLRGIEALDFDNGAANSLDLTLEDVLDLSEEADTELEALLGKGLPESLTIYGDSSDSVTLTNGTEGAFVDTGTSVTDAEGTTLNIYTYVNGGEVLATLAIDSDVAVAASPATS